jgi:hypothetical protein
LKNLKWGGVETGDKKLLVEFIREKTTQLISIFSSLLLEIENIENTSNTDELLRKTIVDFVISLEFLNEDDISDYFLTASSLGLGKSTGYIEASIAFLNNFFYTQDKVNFPKVDSEEYSDEDKKRELIWDGRRSGPRDYYKPELDEGCSPIEIMVWNAFKETTIFLGQGSDVAYSEDSVFKEIFQLTSQIAEPEKQESKIEIEKQEALKIVSEILLKFKDSGISKITHESLDLENRQDREILFLIRDDIIFFLEEIEEELSGNPNMCNVGMGFQDVYRFIDKLSQIYQDLNPEGLNIFKGEINISKFQLKVLRLFKFNLNLNIEDEDWFFESSIEKLRELLGGIQPTPK